MKHIKAILLTLLLLHCIRLGAQLQGQAYIDSLVNELPTQKEDTNKIALLGEISDMYDGVDADKSIKYGMAELELCTKLKLKKRMASACNNLGSQFGSKSEYRKALHYYLKALKLNQEIGNKKGLAAVTCNIGNVYNAQGNYPKALEYLLSALKQDEAGGFSQYAANVTNNLSSIYSSQNNYYKALEYSLMALHLFENMGVVQGVAAVKCNIGSNYQSLKEYDKALEYFLDALRLDEENGFKQYSAIVAINIGKNYTHQKKYSQAIEYFQKALKITDEIGDKSNMASALVNIGNVYYDILTDAKTNDIASGRQAGNVMTSNTPDPATSLSKTEIINKATTYLLRGLEIGKDINAPTIMEQGYEGLAKAYKSNKNFEKALFATENARAISDSVFSQENKEEMIKISLKNDYDRERLTDSLKNSEKQKIAAINLRRQKSYTYLGIAGIMLLTGFSFFIVKERRKSDKLLLNILPGEVAKELKTTGSTTARHFDDVTVIFTDFAKFTETSQKMSPQALIDELHTCFKAFDEITEKYKIEKIKTIGDAYMAVAGLPTADAEHAEHAIKAAKEISAYMTSRYQLLGDKTFQIRVGIHSGHVVAGIVGVKKFAYDIWGDTVNTAARMEQNSEPGRINVSGTTYEQVKDKFDFEYRGEIEAKGKGMMKMYFLSSGTSSI